MRKQQASASQAAWEEQTKRRLALEQRQEMNKVVLNHFTDPTRKTGAAALLEKKKEPVKGNLVDRETFQKVRGESPIKKLRDEENQSAGGLAQYEMRKKGLVHTGNVMVTVAEDVWEDVPGGVAIHAVVDEDWDSLTATCPVVASRQRMTTGKHLFRVHWKMRDQYMGFVSAEGVLRVGFFSDYIDPAEAWDDPSKDGKVFYYRSSGNLYNGSQADSSVLVPGFQPGDTIIAIVNLNEGTASFQKRRSIPKRDAPPLLQESALQVVHGVPTGGMRFGVQFEREGPGVVLLDYVDVSPSDFLTRGEGWKEHGLRHIAKGEYRVAKDCFTKASESFHQAGDKGLRREVTSMVEESNLLDLNEGIGSGATSPFTKAGVVPGSQVEEAVVERSGLPAMI